MEAMDKDETTINVRLREHCQMEPHRRKQTSFLSIIDILANGSHSDNGICRIERCENQTDKSKTISSHSSRESPVVKTRTFLESKLDKVSSMALYYKVKSDADEHAKNVRHLTNCFSEISHLNSNSRHAQHLSLLSRKNANFNTLIRDVCEQPEILELSKVQTRLLWATSFWQRYQLLARLKWSSGVIDGTWPSLDFHKRIEGGPIGHQSSDSTSVNGTRRPPDCLPVDNAMHAFHSGRTNIASHYCRPTRPVDRTRPRRHRQAYTATQLTLLEDEFKINHYLRLDRREMLSQTLGLTENQVKAWFQNRRTKYKKQRTFQQTASLAQTGTRRPNTNQPLLKSATTNTFLY